jgi:hypothetical protein
VKEELNSTLIRRLAVQNVLVVPVVSENCEIPQPIRDQCEVVDFRGNFEDGFLLF